MHLYLAKRVFPLRPRHDYCLGSHAAVFLAATGIQALQAASQGRRRRRGLGARSREMQGEGKGEGEGWRLAMGVGLSGSREMEMGAEVGPRGVGPC